MITTFTATVLAGSLFLASTGTVEAPIRDYRSYLSKPAKSLAPALLASHPMLIKEHWLDKPIITASAVPYGSPKAPVVSRPVLLPMLLKEDWFQDRTLAASAVSPAAGPPSARLVRNERAISDRVTADAADLHSIASSGAPMVHKERWLASRTLTAASAPMPRNERAISDQVAADAALLRNVAIAGTPMVHKERWLGSRTLTAASAPMPRNERAISDQLTAEAAALRKVLVSASAPMAHKERWFIDRARKAAAPRLAAAEQRTAPPVSNPMLIKERWFKSRVFATVSKGPAPSPRYTEGKVLPKGGGRSQIGKPYQVAGRWFTPREEPGYDVEGVASWYGAAFHRRMTSNGEWFDMEYLSAAHPTMPLPSYARVTNTDNGSEIIVRVNDRGPFANDRIIDLSKKCAEALGFKERGITRVRVQYMGAAPLNDGGSHLRAVNRELRRGTPFERVIAAADIATRTVASAASKPQRAF